MDRAVSTTYQILLGQPGRKEAELLERQLQGLSFQLETLLEDRREKLTRMLEKQPPDLLVCSLGLLGDSTPETLQNIRRLAPHMPVILTGRSTGEEAAVDAVLNGANDFVPLERPERLAGAVERLLSHQQQPNGGAPSPDTRSATSLSKDHPFEDYRALVHSIDGILWEGDAETFEITYVSPQAERILGYPVSDWYTDPYFWENHIHPDERDRVIRSTLHQIRQGKDHSIEYRMISAGGHTVWLRDLVTVIMQNGIPRLMRGFMSDITGQRYQAEVQQLENRVLELNSRQNKELAEILRHYLEGIKSLHPDMIPMIHRVENGRLYTWVAPDELSDSYVQALEGVSIGPDVGSCGTAAWLKEKVIASDISRDPRWEGFRELASRHDLKACWSQPVLSTGGSVMATMALYYRTPRTPNGQETDLIDRASRMLQVIIENRQSIEELRETQQLVDRAYQLAGIGDWQLDLVNNHLYWSPAIKELHEVDQDYVPELQTAIEFYRKGEDRETIQKVVNEAIEKGKPFDVELRIITAQDRERWVRAVGEPEFRNGKCQRIYGSTQNIDQRKRAEETLQLSEQRFRAMVQGGSDMISILDEQAHYKYSTPSVERILGWSPEELQASNPFDYIHEADQERLKQVLANLKDQDRADINPFRFRVKQGNWRWIETVITNMLNHPAVNGYVANSRDVTRKMEREQQLSESLKEKKTMLSEIHHRVKNNLAVISGMLYLQTESENNQEIREKLLDSVNRIHSMASIHEHLYKNESFASLNLGENLKELVSQVVSTMNVSENIRTELDCQNVEINVNQAIPCSLIVNEVVTNSIKHAFSGEEKGTITIRLDESDRHIRLIITDDGKGLSTRENPGTHTSMGMTIIGTLAQQLNASYQYGPPPGGQGTMFDLQFNKSEVRGIGNHELA